MPSTQAVPRRPLDKLAVVGVFATLFYLGAQPRPGSVVVVAAGWGLFALLRRTLPLQSMLASHALGPSSRLERGGWPPLHALMPDAHAEDYPTLAAYRLSAAWHELPSWMWDRLPSYEAVLLTSLGNGDSPPLCLARSLALLWCLGRDQHLAAEPGARGTVISGVPQVGGDFESIHLHDLLDECAHALIHPNPLGDSPFGDADG